MMLFEGHRNFSFIRDCNFKTSTLSAIKLLRASLKFIEQQFRPISNCSRDMMLPKHGWCATTHTLRTFSNAVKKGTYKIGLRIPNIGSAFLSHIIIRPKGTCSPAEPDRPLRSFLKERLTDTSK